MSFNNKPSAQLTNHQPNDITQNFHKVQPSLQKNHRRVSKKPYKILDAPNLQDDFYLNLIDWS